MAVDFYNLEDLQLRNERQPVIRADALATEQRIDGRRTGLGASGYPKRHRKGKRKRIHGEINAAPVQGTAGSAMVSGKDMLAGVRNFVQSVVPLRSSMVKVCFTNSAPAVTMSELKDIYTIADRKRIETFLDKHTQLLPLLVAAEENIHKFFDKNDKLSLKIVSDPDEPGSEQLFVYINTSLDAAAGFSKLTELDKAWWLQALEPADGLLCISLEFVCQSATQTRRRSTGKNFSN